DELSQAAPLLENTASRVFGRYISYFGTRDWDVMAEMLADDVLFEDRRRVVNMGVRRGRDDEIANARATAELGVVSVTPTTIATRGERLVLHHLSFSVPEWPGEFRDQMIDVLEIGTDGRITARITFERD